MNQPATAEPLSAQAFLDWEARQATKHEFIRGEILAMVGVTRRHATVAGNVFSWLSRRLRGSPCRVYMADMMLRLEAADAFFYPDVFITCAEADHRAERYMTEPRLIVEVLSAFTEAYDRGEKFACYRRFAFLGEYVLIDPVKRRAEVFRRDATDHWVLYDYDENDPVRFESLDLTLEGTVLYEHTD